MFLQLYSQTIREGESHQAIFNGNEAARGITDVHIGSIFSLPQNFNQTITMLSMTNDGCYLYVILPLSSRVGDYLALVLFVPRQLLISAAADIPTIHETIEHVLLENRDAEPLRHFFEWDYPTLELIIEGKTDFNKYACLWLDNSAQSMARFLGNPILYNEFLRYSGVFLLPPSYQEITNGETFPTFYATTLAAPQIHLQADSRNNLPHKESNKQSTQNNKNKSSDKKKSSGHSEKGKKSLKWLWGLLFGIVLGFAAGFATLKWLLPPEQQKPAATNTIPDNATTDEMTTDENIPDGTTDNTTDNTSPATTDFTNDEPVAPSAYKPSNMEDDYDMDDYDDDFTFDENY